MPLQKFPHTEQLDGANLGEHVLGKDLVVGRGLDLNPALRHICGDDWRESYGWVELAVLQERKSRNQFGVGKTSVVLRALWVSREFFGGPASPAKSGQSKSGRPHAAPAVLGLA